MHLRRSETLLTRRARWSPEDRPANSVATKERAASQAGSALVQISTGVRCLQLSVHLSVALASGASTSFATKGANFLEEDLKI